MYVCRREYGYIAELDTHGNGFWVVRDADGKFVDRDKYSNDLRERYRKEGIKFFPPVHISNDITGDVVAAANWQEHGALSYYLSESFKERYINSLKNGKENKLYLREYEYWTDMSSKEYSLARKEMGVE